ncbi:MAG: cysteine synthase family protein [Holophaga sp.]|nr:cysteine synthase family protein [Holophaga sp.]
MTGNPSAIGHDHETRGHPDLLDHIGGTPLLRLGRIAEGLRPGVELLAKAEHLNPSGSLKDRPAKAMILAAVADGRLTPEKAILDATSGNAGIAYAMIGAAMGYRVTLCLPANASAERKRMLGLYGAAIIETDPGQGSDGARRRALELCQADPGRYFHVDQYNNEANWRAHFDTTGPELWAQSGGRISHFVAGVGTSGLFMGTVRRLKQLNPALRAVAVQPDRPDHGLAGLKHMATASVPGIYDPDLADAQVAVSTAEGQAMARRLALEEGLLVGPSSGASVSAALRLARTVPEGSVVVTVLFDSGARYLADRFWEG